MYKHIFLGGDLKCFWHAQFQISGFISCSVSCFNQHLHRSSLKKLTGGGSTSAGPAAATGTPSPGGIESVNLGNLKRRHSILDFHSQYLYLFYITLIYKRRFLY